MIHLDDVLVLVPHITAAEARVTVLASWTDETGEAAQRVELRGHVAGPRCEYATTLSTRTPLAPLDGAAAPFAATCSPTLQVAAGVLEPCFWEPEHPFCYELQLELWAGGQRADTRRVLFGIRHLAARAGALRLNGRPFVMRGVRHRGTASAAELEQWHRTGCNAWLTRASPELCAQTDRFGPLLLHLLPGDPAAAQGEIERLRNHPSLGIWVLPAAPPGVDDERVRIVRRVDPSRPVAELRTRSQSSPAPSTADVLLIHHAADLAKSSDQPIIVVLGEPGQPAGVRPDDFARAIECTTLENTPSAAGVIL
jgi:hypothetical protein